MFSFISLHHSVCREGSDVNITHDALDLTVQPQQISNLGHPGPSPPWTSDMGPPSHVQTTSDLGPLPASNIW